MNELGTQLVDEGHPNAEDIQTTTENVTSRYCNETLILLLWYVCECFIGKVVDLIEVLVCFSSL